MKLSSAISAGPCDLLICSKPSKCASRRKQPRVLVATTISQYRSVVTYSEHLDPHMVFIVSYNPSLQRSMQLHLVVSGG